MCYLPWSTTHQSMPSPSLTGRSSSLKPHPAQFCPNQSQLNLILTFASATQLGLKVLQVEARVEAVACLRPSSSEQQRKQAQ
eukprot:2330306-Amphidinium_carterae.1